MSVYKAVLLTLVSLCLARLITGQGEVEEGFYPVDCHDIKDKRNGGSEDGEYDIFPYPGDEEPTAENRRKVRAYCEGMTPQATSGVWTVIQRHQDASDPLAFNQTWNRYKSGFGRRSQDFWIGNEALHRLTKGRKYILRVEIDTWDSGLHRHADYEDFRVGNEAEKYKLHVGNYSGDAGDALKYHNGMKFSTIDQDNDTWFKRCTKMLGGGWWFGKCAHCNLNGQAYRGRWTGPDEEYWGGVWWLPMHPTEDYYAYYFKYSVKSEMKIKFVDDLELRGVIA